MSENTYRTEIYNNNEPIGQPPAPEFRPRRSKGRIWIGGFLVALGMILLLNMMGVRIPDFILSWQMFLIALGAFVGARRNFEGAAWLVLTMIGVLFLVDEYFVFGRLQKFILPIVLIGAGLFFIFRPRGNKEYFILDENGNPVPGLSGQDFLDITSVFGGTKKKIFSKTFQGGDMTNIFGGSEIDLSQADLQGIAVLDVTVFFGGATLIIPSHWNVISEAVAVMGEVKDKRKRLAPAPSENSKTLIIKGTVIFGGVDIESF